MAYAEVSDVQARITYTLTESQQTVCESLLEDSALLIDAYNSNASEGAKLAVSCRMVIRALGDPNEATVPIGASQGSMSALGYSQSWTISNGTVGELYISKTEKKLLGSGDSIGSYSPVESLVCGVVE